MDFAEILQLLRQLFSNIVGRKERREQRAEQTSTPTLPAFKGFQSPLKSWENSGNFSPGVATDRRHKKGHDGLDMRAPLGTPVYPIAPGTIKQVYEDPVGGLAVVISHADGVSSYYAHLNSTNVKAGEIVDYNTIIGAVGWSGNAHPSRGGGMPHVHLQTWVNGALTNPGRFFPVKPYTPFDNNREILALPGVKPRPEQAA